MAENREIVGRYVSKGLQVTHAVNITGLQKSTYYYKPNGRPKGKSPSTHTHHKLLGLLSNQQVLNEINDLISPDYHDYGYHVITALLKRKDYIINHKKVNRLMKENHLLHPKKKKSPLLTKERVEFTCPPLVAPFDTIEADIKYIYIHGENRNAYLLSFLCTFCRFVPVWDLQYTMKSEQVIDLLKTLISHPIVHQYASGKIKIVIRTDNGPQFIAKKLAAALESLKINHEFILPGTPQQNGHIESFHNTVQQLVCDRNNFHNLVYTKSIFNLFYYQYNNTRVMKSLLYYSPKDFLNLWDNGYVGIKRNKKNKEIFFFREKPIPKSEIGPSPEDFCGQNEIINLNNSVIKPLEISPV
jgi:transposase InsO family protein